MTFKANEIEQYPYLVYTDDAGNVYDPNGGGGGGSIPKHSIVDMYVYDEDENLTKISNPSGTYDGINVNGEELASIPYSYPDNPITLEIGTCIYPIRVTDMDLILDGVAVHGSLDDILSNSSIIIPGYTDIDLIFISTIE